MSYFNCHVLLPWFNLRIKQNKRGEDLTKSQKYYNDSDNNAQDDVNSDSLI